MRRARLLLFLGLIGLVSPTGSAQALMEFERLDVPFFAGSYYGHAFDGDTLYIETGKFYRREPGSADWSEAWEEWLGGFNRTGRGQLTFSPDGVIYQGHELSFHSLSRDRGDSWQLADYPAITLPFRVTDDTLVGTWNESGYGIALSVDDGLTWAPLPYLPDDDPTGAIPYGFGAVDVETALHGKRIVAMGKSTPSYSDDGGQTWRPAEGFSGPAPIRARSLATIEGGPHDRMLVAAVIEFLSTGQVTRIWRTADGTNWEILGGVFEPLYRVYLTPNTSGVLLAHESDNDRLAASIDGGESWVLLTPSVSSSLIGEVETRGGIRHLSFGPDDHVYATVPGPEGVAGFYRSTVPLSEVPIAADPEPGEIPLTLRVSPNPTQGSVTIELAADAPRSRCSLRILDLLGRTVHATGLLSGSPRSIPIPSSLAAGQYQAVALCEGSRATASFTVTR